VTGKHDSANRVWQSTANFASNNPAGATTIREAGIFQTNDSTHASFYMWARQTFGDIVKGANDNINLTYNITFNAG